MSRGDKWLDAWRMAATNKARIPELPDHSPIPQLLWIRQSKRGARARALEQSQSVRDYGRREETGHSSATSEASAGSTSSSGSSPRSWPSSHSPPSTRSQPTWWSFPLLTESGDRFFQRKHIDTEGAPHELEPRSRQASNSERYQSGHMLYEENHQGKGLK